MKRYILIIICLIGLSTQRVEAQATITLSIDSIVILEPVIMGDFTDFQVRVGVDNTAGPDSIFGDIFYYYLTDSMIAAGATPRIFELEANNEWVYDGFIDTIPIDILPNEIHASPPMNLIVIWPAMIDPSILDTVCDSTEAWFAGYIGIPTLPNLSKGNIVFPCPALKFLYIKPDEIEQIREMIITNMLGEEVKNIPGANLSTGWVNIDELNPGTYMAILLYKNGTTASMKFLKE